MTRKIAVVVTDRQDEALRMSVGLTLMDDEIDVFMLNTPVSTEQDVALNFELLREMERHVYSSESGEPGTEYLPTAAMAEKLLEYDHILPY
ncbi:MAG: hypothetical protein JSW10_02355 [Pseudomonadota bacterium]|nr:MAG: hypothetical protein JSW10_02355 [Pseudomonadota bacterium]